METAAAVEGGPQPIETLPNASNMVPSNAAAESGAPGARDEEEDDDADGAADGTQRNDEDGQPKPKRARRSRLEVRSETLQKAEIKVAKKQVCSRPTESQREMSRTPTAVRLTQVDYDACKAANDGTPTGQAALAEAEEALRTAIAAKNAADKEYTAAKQKAEKQAQEQQKKEAKRKQRAADSEVAGDVAAGVVAAYYSVPEFQGRSNNKTDCWKKAAENFIAYCKTQGWKTDWTPEQCKTIYTKERQLYISALRQYAQTKSGQEAPESNPEKVAAYNEAHRPAFRIFHNEKVFESDDVIPPYTMSGAGPAEREIVAEDGKITKVLLRAGGGVNLRGQKNRPRDKKRTKYAKSGSSSSSSVASSDSEQDPLDTSTSTVHTSADDAPATRTHKKQSFMQEMLSGSDKRYAKQMKKVHDKGNKTLLALGTMLANRKHAAPTAGTAVDSDHAAKLITSLGVARARATESTDDAMKRNWEREANRLQSELDKLYS